MRVAREYSSRRDHLRAARSRATSQSVMRRVSSKVRPVTRYLPLTTSVGVPSIPVAVANSLERSSRTSMAGLSMATSAAGYGGANRALQSLGGLGASALLAHYSRDNEREADALGMEYMAKTGYSPEGMAQLMELLIRNNQREPNALQAMFSTHPMSSERLANVRNAINSQYSGQMRQATNRERYMDETANLRRFKPMLNTLQKASAATAAKKLNEAGSGRLCRPLDDVQVSNGHQQQRCRRKLCPPGYAGLSAGAAGSPCFRRNYA